MSTDKYGGWICLYRKIRESWIWDDPEKLRAWLDILLMVNHQDRPIPFNGHHITVHAGQRVTSLDHLAQRWGWTRNRVDRFIRTLEGTGMVTAIRTPNGTLLTVVNWAFYQGGRDTNDVTNDATDEATNDATNGTPMKHKQQYNNDNNEEQGQSAPRTSWDDLDGEEVTW